MNKKIRKILLIASVIVSSSNLYADDLLIGVSPMIEDQAIQDYEYEENLMYGDNDQYVAMEEIPCVDFSQNKFIIPGNKDLVLKLYNKFDQMLSLGSGEVSIMHMGGSHVQAGIFSHQLRQNFKKFLDDGASCMGIIFPYKTMGTNAPVNYKMSTTGVWTKARCIDRNPSLPLGVSGAAIRSSSANASISFDLKSQGDNLWLYHELLVLGDGNNEDYPPMLIANGDTVFPTIYEDGAWKFNLSNNELTEEKVEASEGKVIFPGANITPVTIRGLIPKNIFSGVMYHEAGINGASVPAWLRCHKFEEELKHIKPDLVIFGIGINDANVSPTKFDKEKFKDNYRRLIAKIRRREPESVFLFITNNDCKLNMKGYGGKYNPNSIKVEQAFIELAKEYDGIVWNLFRVMGGPGSSKEWVNYQLMQKDRIHFTRAGYELIGDLLYNAFVTDINNIK